MSSLVNGRDVDELLADKDYDPILDNGKTLLDENKGKKESFCNQTTTDKLAEVIRNGGTILQACDMCNIDRRTFVKWYKLGKTAVGNANHIVFYETIRKAKTQAIYDLLKLIKMHSQKEWKAAAWLVERYERFAKERKLNRLMKNDTRTALFELVKQALAQEVPGTTSFDSLRN